MAWAWARTAASSFTDDGTLQKHPVFQRTNKSTESNHEQHHDAMRRRPEARKCKHEMFCTAQVYRHILISYTYGLPATSAAAKQDVDMEPSSEHASGLPDFRLMSPLPHYFSVCLFRSLCEASLRFTQCRAVRFPYCVPALSRLWLSFQPQFWTCLTVIQTSTCTYIPSPDHQILISLNSV